MEVPTSPTTEAQAAEFEAQALLVGERIDLRGLELPDRLAVDPLAVRVGGGIAVVFRYGAVVFFDVRPEEVEHFLDRLNDRVSQPLAPPETETLRIRIDPEAREAMQDSTVFLRDRSIDRSRRNTVLSCMASRASGSIRILSVSVSGGASG